MDDRFKANLTRLLLFLIAHFALIAASAINCIAQTMPPHVSMSDSNGYFPVSSKDESENGFLPPMTSLKSILEGFEEQPELIEQNEKGAQFPERPLLGPSHIKLVDPRNYKRVKALENDDPNSFWYTMRPNLFNIQVDDEWDWLNLINTDRPDFTDTPFSVGAGIGYLENGYTNFRSNGPDSHSTLRTLPESLLRYPRATFGPVVRLSSRNKTRQSSGKISLKFFRSRPAWVKNGQAVRALTGFLCDSLLRHKTGCVSKIAKSETQTFLRPSKPQPFS